MDDFSTSSLLYLIYVFILRRRLSVFSPSPPRESPFFFLPPLRGSLPSFFSLPWREGVRGRGEVFQQRDFLRAITLTLTLSRQGRGKEKESRERGKRCKALPSRERGKTSGIAKRDKPKVVIAKPCLVTHDERRGSQRSPPCY